MVENMNLPRKSCGGCTMCCKLLGIADLPTGRKEAGVWCKLCNKGTGCGIYETRPQSCREFECGWLLSQGFSDGTHLPPELRPDRSKAVIDVDKSGEAVVVHVDPATPGSWRSGVVRNFIGRMLRAGRTVVISAGNNAAKTILEPVAGQVVERKARFTPRNEDGSGQEFVEFIE